MLFTDDMALQVYRTIKSSFDYAHWKLQLDITALILVDGISQNGLSLQPPKCCYMLITRKTSHSLPTPTLYVSGTALQLYSVYSVQYLGIHN